VGREKREKGMKAKREYGNREAPLDAILERRFGSGARVRSK
jgi:hypothetical protein